MTAEKARKELKRLNAERFSQLLAEGKIKRKPRGKGKAVIKRERQQSKQFSKQLRKAVKST